MKQIKQKKKSHKQKQRDLKEKVGMFDLLPENCLTCLEPFDKKNKEQVQSWFVVVKNEERTVRLYCPDCWEKAKDIVEDFRKRVEEKIEKE
jgi:hypothetical protein